ncbi:hypothetical protein Cme02nite_38410 [Catellatospora methionotrophica]|uniref:Uncharacterized protein n=1 Tax=Catellatospora methionotrophica TaxID=121620 RepID=A0A8J3LBV8_9ACTN|nr:hypothetical protein [Catellatospora methionotrophica]GIG15509.1 hypothetical protein Cme02nite_38410 [Catellatospora methionotrophica]
MSAPYYAAEQPSEFCELCDTTMQNGEAYYKEGTVAYHEKCAATCDDGSIDHGMSRMVAINRRLTLRPTNAAAAS